MTATVRRARAADVPAILEISNRAAIETAANFAVEPETLDAWRDAYDATHAMHPWLVAVDDADSVLGFAKASPWKGRCAYTYTVEVTVYVRPEHHGQGLGRALYTRLFEILRRQGYRGVIGGITLPNAASVRLHESFGMERVALFEAIGWKFERWHDVGYWYARLQPTDTPPVAARSVADVW